MEFYVNGSKLDVTLEDEKTVGDVLRGFEMSCEENKLATVAIALNGEAVPAEKFDAAAAVKLEDSTKIEVNVISEQAVTEGFKQAAKDITETASLLKEIPVQLQNGNDAKAKASITRLADVIDNFCHVVALSTLFPAKFDSLKIDGNTLSEFFAEFQPVLKDLNEALENTDTVLIGDLSEYEICPRLEALSNAVKDLN